MNEASTTPVKGVLFIKDRTLYCVASLCFVVLCVELLYVDVLRVCFTVGLVSVYSLYVASHCLPCRVLLCVVSCGVNGLRC